MIRGNTKYYLVCLVGRREKQKEEMMDNQSREMGKEGNMMFGTKGSKKTLKSLSCLIRDMKWKEWKYFICKMTFYLVDKISKRD